MLSHFVIDGPDGTGKTTLAKKIAERYKIPYIHLGYEPNERDFETQFEKINSMIYNHESFVVDRYIWSNLVYSLIYRNTRLLPNFDLYRLNMEGTCHDIICLPRDKERWLKDFSRLCKEREELFDETKMGDVYDSFRTLYLCSHVRSCHMKLFDMYEDEIDESSYALTFRKRKTDE